MAEKTAQGTIFVRHGLVSRPAIVLIHGLGLDRQVWQWQLATLCDDYQVLTYDLFGHGGSADPPRTPSLRLYSEQLSQLLDHCNIISAAIVGFSLGGMIARRFAQDQPGRVTALGILHSPHQRDPQSQAAIVKRVEQARSDGPAATVEAALKRWFTDAYRTANRQMMDLVRSWVMANNPQIYHTIYRVLADGVDEIAAPTPPISCPTLVLTGDEDYGNGPQMSQAIAADIEHAQVHILKGLRHMALVESPQAVSAPLRAFLDRALAGYRSTPDALEQEKRALRNAFGTFATGVTVVTTRQPDGTPRGMTANSFTSVSLDPPLLLICIAKSAHSCEILSAAGHFAINVLSEDQKAISGLFASQKPDKFEFAKWQSGLADMPLLNGSMASFTCARENLVDAGDHIILIGRVIDHVTHDGEPLGYFNGNYFSIGLEQSLVSAASHSGDVTIGAILQQDQKLLLTVAQDGSCSVPKAPKQTASLEGLRAMLHDLELNPVLDFLYAVYQDSETGAHGIFYHGTINGKAPEGTAFFALEDIPLEKVNSLAERSMLARYKEEFRHGSFGIYQGDETKGTVHRVTAPQPSKY
jgi:flavin reductase (DIM6/NTAB) family NADH-FMN oxidoreductase RutF/pimeloyl-ACP methyl ester carboxylesterase